MELSINLPSYEEEENLKILIPEIISVIESIPVETFEINIIDTIEPKDNTNNLFKNFKNVRYFNREGSNSFGSAYRKAINISQGKYIIFMDADGSHSPNFIPILLNERFNSNMVIASRYVRGGQTENSCGLIFLSKILNIIYSISLGIEASDISNSFKLYRKEDLDKIEIKCENFDVIEEIFYKLKLKIQNFSSIEIPYTFKKRIHGKTKRNLFKFTLTFIGTLIRLKFYSIKSND
jgi:dolichol-phosphate mannosyltransferase